MEVPNRSRDSIQHVSVAHDTRAVRRPPKGARTAKNAITDLGADVSAPCI